MRNIVYIVVVPTPVTTAAPRWELYKLLAEPIRLRLLSLCALEEFAVGELAELVGESPPNVSRHLKPLRKAGLLLERREGTRVYVRLDSAFKHDAVIQDALRTGERLCEEDGSTARIKLVVHAREAASRDFFAKVPAANAHNQGWPSELSAYISAIAPLIERRTLAIDVGTGEGGLLEVLAPIYQTVFAFDRSEARLAASKARVEARQFTNVEMWPAELGDEKTVERVQALGGADAVFAARILHHAPRPAAAMAELKRLASPGGMILVIDYVAHSDETMRSGQADTWLGFTSRELRRFAHEAGLEDVSISAIPAARCGLGPDGHLGWQVLAARRPKKTAIA